MASFKVEQDLMNGKPILGIIALLFFQVFLEYQLSFCPIVSSKSFISFLIPAIDPNLLISFNLVFSLIPTILSMPDFKFLLLGLVIVVQTYVLHSLLL